MATSCYFDLMSNFKKNVDLINESIKGHAVTVVCASKYVSSDEIRELHNLGVKHFGENRVDALLDKKENLQDVSVIWHLIGTLQTNKVKKIINEIDYFHALDSLKLAKTINNYRTKPLNCFIEVNVLKEESKHGIETEDLTDFINEVKKYDKIKVVGLMTMGKQNDIDQTTLAFKKLNELKTFYGLESLSMGMTDDYLIALTYGADFIRIGRKFIL